MSDEQDADAPNVVRLVTLPEREAEEAAAVEEMVVDVAHAEAVAMLETALDLVKAKRTSCVAVAFAFSDRTFAYLTPAMPDDVGLLLGAISSMENKIHRTNAASETLVEG